MGRIGNLQQVCSSAAFGSCLGHGHILKSDKRASSSYPPSLSALHTRAVSQSIIPGLTRGCKSHCQRWGCSECPKSAGQGR